MLLKKTIIKILNINRHLWLPVLIYHSKWLFARICLPGGMMTGKIKRNPSGKTILLCGHSVKRHLAGAELCFIDTAIALCRSGFNLVIVLPEYNRHYYRLLNNYSLRIYLLPYKWWGLSDENRMVVWQLMDVIRNERIDVVYTNTIMIREPLSAARLTGIPGITHLHELLDDDPAITRSIGLAKEEIIQAVRQRSGYLVANSVATGGCYNISHPDFIIPNTVDNCFFSLNNQIHNEAITVGLISSNIPKKGVSDFISIALALKNDRIPIRFLLIGPWNNWLRSPEMKSRLDMAGIKVTGYFPNPHDTVQQANIVLNLSHFSESFGRTILESMAAGRPVIAYNHGAVPELITDGFNGFLVPYKDIDATVSKLRELAGNPARLLEMGENGRKRAMEKYSFEHYQSRLEKVLKTVAASGEKPFSADLFPGKDADFKSASRYHSHELTVSVIIPNYNYSRYLKERIQSIAEQTYPPAEVIFLDDASSDDSVTTAEHLLKSLGLPYRIIVNSHNEGPFRQWIRGVNAARGRYIWIAEADDSSEKTFLEESIRRIFSDGSAMCYAQSALIDENSKEIAFDNRRHTDDLNLKKWKSDYCETGVREAIDFLFYRNIIPNISACVFDSIYLKEIPDELYNMKFTGDWLLYGHILARGSISYIASSLNKYRLHQNSVTRRNICLPDYLYEIMTVKKYLADHFPVHSCQIEKMIRFLDKDFIIDGVAENSKMATVAEKIRHIKEIAGNRRRIVLITTNEGTHDGGSEQLWIQSALELRKRNHDVMVVIKKWKPSPYFFELFRKAGIKILYKNELIFKDIYDYQPDLVVISTGDQDEGTGWYHQCSKYKIRYVIVNQLTKETDYWPIRKNLNNLVRKGYANAQKVFFTSANNHRVMQKRLGTDINNASCFYNPVFADRNHQFPFPPVENGLNIALPARLLVLHKGQHLAVDLMNQQKWRNRKVSLHLYGIGPDEEYLKSLVERYRLSNVFFHEPRWKLPGHDLTEVWKTCHILLMPSFMEGMPLVLISAMLNGRVPVVTDVGGHAEVIEDNVSGFIAPKPTVADLDDALERAWQNLDNLEDIGQKARKSVLAFLPEDPVSHFTGQILLLT